MRSGAGVRSQERLPSPVFRALRPQNEPHLERCCQGFRQCSGPRRPRLGTLGAAFVTRRGRWRTRRTWSGRGGCERGWRMRGWGWRRSKGRRQGGTGQGGRGARKGKRKAENEKRKSERGAAGEKKK